MLYTLNLHSSDSQLYLNKTPKKKNCKEKENTKTFRKQFLKI